MHLPTPNEQRGDERGAKANMFFNFQLAATT